MCIFSILRVLTWSGLWPPEPAAGSATCAASTAAFFCSSAGEASRATAAAGEVAPCAPPDAAGGAECCAELTPGETTVAASTDLLWLVLAAAAAASLPPPPAAGELIPGVAAELSADPGPLTTRDQGEVSDLAAVAFETCAQSHTQLFRAGVGSMSPETEPFAASPVDQSDTLNFPHNRTRLLAPAKDANLVRIHIAVTDGHTSARHQKACSNQ